MNRLFIDCSYGMSLFVVDDKENVFSKIDLNQKKHTDELLLQVDELLKNAGLKIADIDVIGVCIGPGSFTGVRVAISICKGLAVSSKVKVVVLSNFDIYDHTEEDYILVLEGFSSFIYTRKVLDGKAVDVCEDVKEFSEKYLSNCSDIQVYVNNEKMQNILKNVEISSKIANNCTVLRFNEEIDNNKFVNLNSIEPIYLRASQAEIERNKKLNGTPNG